MGSDPPRAVWHQAPAGVGIRFRFSGVALCVSVGLPQPKALRFTSAIRSPPGQLEQRVGQDEGQHGLDRSRRRPGRP